MNVNLRPNDAPVVVSDQYLVEMDTVLVVDVPSGVLSNDSDADDDPFTAVLQSDVSSGALAFNADGSFTYTPAAGFTGTDTFMYFATDNRDDSEVARVVLPVNSPTNQVPIAFEDEYTADFETTLLVDAVNGVLANDTDADVSDVLTVILTTVEAEAAVESDAK